MTPLEDLQAQLAVAMKPALDLFAEPAPETIALYAAIDELSVTAHRLRATIAALCANEPVDPEPQSQPGPPPLSPANAIDRAAIEALASDVEALDCRTTNGAEEANDEASPQG